MSFILDAPLNVRNTQLRDETLAGGNTATELGQILLDVVDSKLIGSWTSKLTLSTADLASLDSAPITIGGLVVQGAGTLLIPKLVMMRYVFNSVAFNDVAIEIRKIGGSSPIFSVPSLVNGTATVIANALAISGEALIDDNVGFEVSAPATLGGLGDGSLEIYVEFTVLVL